MDVKLDLNKIVSWDGLGMIIISLLIARTAQLGADYVRAKWLVGIPILSLQLLAFQVPSKHWKLKRTK